MRQPKKHYYILYNDEYVGQTWAVTEAKARVNWWWDNVKYNDQFSYRAINPEDFEAICVH